jgi:hypothetical protein
MAARVVVAPVETVADTPDGLLEYLVRRTAATIGTFVDRSDAVILGEVVETGALSVPVRDEDLDALQPWLSGESGAVPHIDVVHTLVRAAEWLVGEGSTEYVRVVHVPSQQRVVASDDHVAIFATGDSGLLFLCRISSTLGYASYLSGDEFQLSPGETGVRAFGVTEILDQSGSHNRIRTTALDETIEAIRWYASTCGDIDRLRAGLSQHNRLVVRHSIRQLALRRVEGTAKRFLKMDHSATADLRLHLALGLWVLGEHEAARLILDQLLQEIGVETFLAQWGLKHSLTEGGQRTATLFGPAA